MFQYRDWPEGFEFPACSRCNHGSADDDLLISLLARTDPFTDRGDRDGRLPGIIGSVHQRFPDLIGKMMPSAIEARTMNRRLGRVPAAGETNQQAGPVRVTDEMHTAVKVFAAKLTKAVYYMHSNRVFPVAGRLHLKWFTNADLINNGGRYPVFDMLEELDGFVPEMVRAKSLLNDQFEYKLSISNDFDLLALQARFGLGFGLAVFACTMGDQLNALFASVEARTGRPSPFEPI